MWNSLEITKLAVQAATPIVVTMLGLYLTQLAKRFDDRQWRNQRLIEKRIAIYDDLASDLNDLLCYFTFIGSWKELRPIDVIAMKRRIDKKIYLAAPLFSHQFFERSTEFINLCYATFQGWGVDARLRTAIGRRKEAAGANWQQNWDELFADDDITDPHEVRRAYQALMHCFSNEMGIASALGQVHSGRIPGNIDSVEPPNKRLGRTAKKRARTAAAR
jgi:hypothetical protein